MRLRSARAACALVVGLLAAPGLAAAAAPAAPPPPAVVSPPATPVGPAADAVSVAPTPRPSDVDLERVLTAVQKRHAGLQRLTTTVRQVSRVKPLDTIRRRTSRLQFQKPALLRWEYAAPDPVLYVADGSVLWMYQPDENLAVKLTVTESQLEAALRFMFGLDDVRASFDVTLDASLAPLAYHLHLVPRKTQQHYRRLTLVVDPKSFDIRETFVTDPLDNVHQYIFDDPDHDAPIPPEAFVFTPPAGTTVRDLTRPGAP